MDTHFLLLADVARILKVKAHQIAYCLATGQVTEPALRVANKRVFSADDVVRLACHFGVSPKWPSPAPTAEVEPADRHEGFVLKPPFEVFGVGETGHEVRDGDGAVFCWAADRARALIVAGLLESAVRN